MHTTHLTKFKSLFRRTILSKWGSQCWYKMQWLALTTSSSSLVHLKSVRYAPCPNLSLNTCSLPCIPCLTNSIMPPSDQRQDPCSHPRVLPHKHKTNHCINSAAPNSYCGSFFSCHFPTVFFSLHILITPQIMYQRSNIWSNGEVNLLHVVTVTWICYSRTMVRWICYSHVRWWDEFVTHMYDGDMNLLLM